LAVVAVPVFVPLAAVAGFCVFGAAVVEAGACDDAGAEDCWANAVPQSRVPARESVRVRSVVLCIPSLSHP